MRNLGIALVVASLANAANAASLNPDHCRALAGKAQRIADQFNDMKRGVEGLSDVYIDVRGLNIEIGGGLIDRERRTKSALIDALAAYRDANDALASEIRACKPTK